MYLGEELVLLVEDVHCGSLDVHLEAIFVELSKANDVSCQWGNEVES